MAVGFTMSVATTNEEIVDVNVGLNQAVIQQLSRTSSIGHSFEFPEARVAIYFKIRSPFVCLTWLHGNW